MSHILNISEGASIAMHALILLANNGNELLSNKRIAETFSISANHSSKVLQRLLKSGFISALRGPRGGYTLSVEPDTVTLLDIYRVLDGEPDHSGCLFGKEKHCFLQNCLFSDMISEADKLIEKHLASVSLADCIKEESSLQNK